MVNLFTQSQVGSHRCAYLKLATPKFQYRLFHTLFNSLHQAPRILFPLAEALASPASPSHLPITRHHLYPWSSEECWLVKSMCRKMPHGYAVYIRTILTRKGQGRTVLLNRINSISIFMFLFLLSAFRISQLAVFLFERSAWRYLRIQ